MFTVEEYVFGLQTLQSRLSETQLQMLRLHYAAPDCIVSPAQMASSLDWSNQSSVHAQYGKLGRKIAEAIGKKIELGFDGEEHPVTVIAEFCGSSPVEWAMWENFALALEKTGLVQPEQTFHFAEEVIEAISYVEGSPYKAQVDLYERSLAARGACIKHFGPKCQICDFDFSSVYGDSMEGFIHVHHLEPLSEIGEKYKVNPTEDLIPVCPNCHAVIHSRRPAYSPDEVRSMLRKGVPS